MTLTDQYQEAALPPAIATFTGPLFSYENPEVNLEDVAHGLSNVCRFGGHTDEYYSVAEHSLLVAAIMTRHGRELALAALWHDAHEAYVGDLPTPLKRILGPEYRTVIERIDAAVCGFLGISWETLHHPLIKEADRKAMLYEASILQPRSEAWAFTRQMAHPEAEAAATFLPCLLPAQIKKVFLEAHHLLLNDEAWGLD